MPRDGEPGREPALTTSPKSYQGDSLTRESRADRSLDHVVPGTAVAGRDGLFGTVSRVEREGETGSLQALWVHPTALGRELAVPVLYVEAAYPGLVCLTVRGAWLVAEALEHPLPPGEFGAGHPA